MKAATPTAPATRATAVARTRPVDGERAARAALRAQVARLERELCELAGSAWPRHGFDWRVPDAGGARLLTFAELERLRDRLATGLADARQELAVSGEREESYRRLIEEMYLDPVAHRWVRVQHADIGEPGCRSVHVRPRLGLLGVLASWWRVVVSSGCP